MEATYFHAKCKGKNDRLKSSCTAMPGFYDPDTMDFQENYLGFHILATYCVRYPHAISFLWNKMPHFLLKSPEAHAV